jgi:hypothetical protein
MSGCAPPESRSSSRLVTALRKLLHAVYSVAKYRRPFVIAPARSTQRPCSA